MEVKEKKESNQGISQLTLFGFELNRPQTSLILILSLIGIFILPIMLAGDIFLNLFQLLFNSLPAYLSDPSHYSENYLSSSFSPILISLFRSTIYLILSIYALRKILRSTNAKHKVKEKTIHQERIVNWFGLKISHGQSIYIFCASIVGIFYIAQLFFGSIFSSSFLGNDVLETFCWIPYSPSSRASHEILVNNVPLALKLIFFLVCLSNLFIVRRGKPMISSKRYNKNYSLLVFMVSFVIFILLSARFFCHLALFNYEISLALGIPYNAPNPYQNEDFIKTVTFLVICLALMISSIFLKEPRNREVKTSENISWLRVKLTPHRALILLSIALLYILFFADIYITLHILMGGAFNFTLFSLSIFDIILFPIIIFCYYPIEKILKNRCFDNVIRDIDNSKEFNAKWFKYLLSKTDSVIFLSVSSGVVGIYIYQLLAMNMSAQGFLQNLSSDNSYLLFSFPAITAVICIILVLIVYTVKNTLPSIKNSK